MSEGESPDGLGREQLAKLQKLAGIMDSAFVIPGTHIRFGADPILGLVPVIGDTLPIAVSAYIYSFARRAGVPRHKRMRMLWNIFLDWITGLIPLAGDIFDIGFKANNRNIRIIEAYALAGPRVD